jgi:hypothetical protein
VNIRTTASTDSARLGQLAVGASQTVDGQAPVGNFTWFRLTGGGWVRSDVVTTSGDCSTLPTVEVGTTDAGAGNVQPTQAPAVPPPAATPETGG